MPLKNLTYPPFAAILEIRNAVSNNPPLKRGARNAGVMMLQASLIELGYKMPRSTKNSKQTDGVFGFETFNVVTQFQEDNKLEPQNGIAGKNTIILLDKLLAKKNNSFIPVKPPAPLTPKPYVSDNYRVGSANPKMSYDAGSGVFDSEDTEATMWALKQAILQILPPLGMSASTFIGYDAAMNMKHYLSALGTPKKINLEKMIRESKTARAHLEHEINQAKSFIELARLPVGKHEITSKNIEGIYNYKEDSKNWYFAIGGFNAWGKGVVTVNRSGSGETWYELDFEYHIHDRYNWDKGKQVEIAGITITDEFMGKFHRQGLAQEFNSVGMVKRNHIQWIQGRLLSDSVYEPQPKKGR